MISVEEAKKRVFESVEKTQAEKILLKDALNYYLAEDVYAPIDVPLFTQSAMDGYAFKFSDVNLPLKIVDLIPAGDTRKIVIDKGEAVRIFTGSKVPESCDTVVMQELTDIEDEMLLVKDAGLKLGGNVRKKGYQIKSGEIALTKGSQLNAAAIGFLSSLGITEVYVSNKPKVAIIATGSELVKPGMSLLEGQIYESNSSMLSAALDNMGIESRVIVVKDDIIATKSRIKELLFEADMLILSGGISVGDYDFVKEALETNGVKEIFYKIKQKPGKPLYFGKQNEKLVFALPGNPAASLSCFYIYVYPAIKLLLGANHPELRLFSLPINQDYIKKEGRAQFLKARINQESVSIMEGQESDALQSFAEADGLVYVSAEVEKLHKGTLVEVYILPNK